MRPRFVIFLLAAIVVILAIVFWLRPVRPPANLEPTSIAQLTNNVPATPTTAANVASQSVPGTSQANTSPANPKPSVVNNVSPQEVTKEFVEGKNAPVDFYGQVIDQDSNALSGVDIKVSIRHWTVPDPLVPEIGSKDIQLEQNSDANGRFEIHGETGDGFGVGLTKDGYEAEPGQRSFGPVGGSFDQPVVFKMWSTNIHEKLITGEKSFHIVPDGRPYFINLTDDTISESGEGDLKVWVQYTNQVVHGQLYDWSSGIEVINGGLLEEPFGSVMYSAPADGYVPSFRLQQQIKGGQSGEIGDRCFYLALKNGQEYGRMNINLYAPYGYISPGLIHISYAINPSGSRILR